MPLATSTTVPFCLPGVRILMVEKLIYVLVGYTTSVPERTWHGTRRHFFSFAKPEVTKGGKLHRVGIIDEEILKRDELVFQTQYQMFLGIYIY